MKKIKVATMLPMLCMYYFQKQISGGYYSTLSKLYSLSPLDRIIITAD